MEVIESKHTEREECFDVYTLLVADDSLKKYNVAKVAIGIEQWIMPDLNQADFEFPNMVSEEKARKRYDLN